MSLSSRLSLLSLAACSSLFLASISHCHATAKPAADDVISSSDVGASDEKDQIIAVINGQILTQHDVEDRARLFVRSTGLPISPSVMQRMRVQIIHQLINERLKMQEILRRHINIEPEQIAQAISNIEARNGMPPNALRNRLKADGVSLTTLIDQIRVQLGWMQVLREELGPRSRVTPEQITQRENALQAEAGRPQYMMSQIFVPVADPRHDEAELAFTQTIIKQLRDGAPFPIVAAQFSQDQSALEGGSRGWVQEDSLEPEVLAIVRQMPIGAISNPIKVPGGFVIATVHARRTVGKQLGTIVSLRQAFFPFTSPLNPADPTDQQKLTLQRATSAAQSLHGCDAIEALNRSLGDKRPSNPGLQIMEHLAPQMKSIVEKLPIGRSSHPLIATDGIALLMVCSKEQRNLAQQSPGQIADQLMNERVEQASQQLQRALQRHAVIQMRPAAKTVLSHG
ncbi:peptidylprolyl isomerase [Saccharibacter sp. 17.LH.SD]|uniref:peptidylprolyl isomerase n=1 Tax=Saccharibacter sp. 17.LH.SD TaxID=2689393 RepID=UPI00136B267A|nr:peptidylprolyl isomerase [Saccharibacter sp. 17.LH.SD]MXV44777.1 peptidylprolyl isomerase [Saccharibacter sp. 17.LH.SD]